MIAPQVPAPTEHAGQRPGLGGLWYVCIGVVLFATSPVLVRFAAPLTPFQITFGRMAAAALCLALASAVIRQPFGAPWRDTPRFALYGFIAALHFLLFVASLSYTSIAHSLTLVYTAPLFVTACSAIYLKERLPRRKLVGLPIVVAGIAILAGLEPRLSTSMIVGDLMALGSAICFGLYSVAGRQERSRYPLVRYAGAVYLWAAIWLAPTALVGGYPLALAPPGAIAAVAILGIFPLAIGHTLYNASLRRTHPTYVNLIATQEVTGGIVLGGLFLGEWPSIAAAVGAIVSLIGVALVLVVESPPSKTPPIIEDPNERGV